MNQPSEKNVDHLDILYIFNILEIFFRNVAGFSRVLVQQIGKSWTFAPISTLTLGNLPEILLFLLGVALGKKNFFQNDRTKMVEKVFCVKKLPTPEHDHLLWMFAITFFFWNHT